MRGWVGRYPDVAVELSGQISGGGVLLISGTFDIELFTFTWWSLLFTFLIPNIARFL